MIGSLKKICERSQKEEKAFWEIILEDDCSERGRSEKEAIDEVRKIWRAMKESDDSYDPERKSESALVGGEGALMEAYAGSGEALSGDFAASVMTRALKTAASNACMRRIVAAPTAGSCGVLPAVLISMQERFDFNENEMLRALFTAGGIGGVIAKRASLSGAEGGCQAEVGSAAAMAAGAAAFLMIKRKRKPRENEADIHDISLSHAEPDEIIKMNEAIVNACAFALKNLLGLACDPVAGLVEVPCVKRNVIGAMDALSAADMALAGIRSVIPPDEVIDAMGRVGRQLPESIRETALGGLAATPTGQEIRKKIMGK